MYNTKKEKCVCFMFLSLTDLKSMKQGNQNSPQQDTTQTWL